MCVPLTFTFEMRRPYLPHPNPGTDNKYKKKGRYRHWYKQIHFFSLKKHIEFFRELIFRQKSPYDAISKCLFSFSWVAAFSVSVLQSISTSNTINRLQKSPRPALLDFSWSRYLSSSAKNLWADSKEWGGEGRRSTEHLGGTLPEQLLNASLAVVGSTGKSMATQVYP